jgi:hypothetical protein
MECNCQMIHGKGFRATRTKGSKENPYYVTWQNMVQRTSNPKNDNYSYYGGRGIGMCLEWRSSFLSFLDFLPADRDSSLTIDRIDNEKGYCPHNVKLSYQSEQVSNRRRDNKHGFRNVYWHRKDRNYVCHLQIDGKRYHIGSFKRARDAHEEFVRNYIEWYGRKPAGLL